MLQSIITAVLIFAGTSADLLLILMLFFAKVDNKREVREIYLGQFIGSGLLVLISLFFAYVLKYVPNEKLLGLLGIIPIILGIKVLFSGNGADEEMVDKSLADGKGNNLIPIVVGITFASCGADNIGLFVPYFITLKMSYLLPILAVFALMIYLLVFIAEKLGETPAIAHYIEKHGRWFISIIFITLGLFILLENHSLELFF